MCGLSFFYHHCSSEEDSFLCFFSESGSQSGFVLFFWLLVRIVFLSFLPKKNQTVVCTIVDVWFVKLYLFMNKEFFIFFFLFLLFFFFISNVYIVHFCGTQKVKLVEYLTETGGLFSPDMEYGGSERKIIALGWTSVSLWWKRDLLL